METKFNSMLEWNSVFPIQESTAVQGESDIKLSK